MKLFGRGITGFGIIFTCILLAGCQSGRDKKDESGFAYDPLKGDNGAAAMSASSGLPGSDTAHLGSPSLMDANGSTAILQAGDTISVKFNDLPTELASITDQIKEDGSITLYFNEKFQVAGKSIHELQAEIHNRYVPKYYKLMTPSVMTADRFFSVGGEVHAANRYVWTPGMTVLRAIDASGGFTDFSNKKKVIITRANTRKQEYENCVKALQQPELDLPIYPGDQLFVKKKLW